MPEDLSVFAGIADDDEIVVGGLLVAILLDSEGNELVKYRRHGEIKTGAAIYALEVSKLLVFEGAEHD